MKLQGVLVNVGLALVICTVQGFPRDSSVLKTEEITQIDGEAKAAKDQFVEVPTTKDQVQDASKTTKDQFIEVPTTKDQVQDASKTTKDQFIEVPTTTDKNEEKIPGRVPCQFEEPTEVLVCQEHCLPKGYSYGLCVGFQCSCI